MATVADLPAEVVNARLERLRIVHLAAVESVPKTRSEDESLGRYIAQVKCDRGSQRREMERTSQPFALYSSWTISGIISTSCWWA